MKGGFVNMESKSPVQKVLQYLQFRRDKDGKLVAGEGGATAPVRPVAAMDLESHQYEPDESEVWRRHQAQRHLQEKIFWWSSGKKRAFQRWWLAFAVGVVTGILGLIVSSLTKSLNEWKFGTAKYIQEMEKLGLVYRGTTFLTYAGFNLFYVLIATFAVYLEPSSRGSGIPEVKCYLNGVDVPGVMRLRTLACKMLGVCFSVSGGLPAGKEGPMIHSGAVVAGVISQGKECNALGYDTSFAKFQDFRNDREKRDFVACGAAAGVAAAFGSPIGGVLFSLEEGASFWSTKITWRAFFCAMMTVLTLYVVKNAEAFWMIPDQSKMFSFGEFYSLKQDRANYMVWELLLFIVVGCLGGLMGAAFNATSEKFQIWRGKNVKTTRKNVAEALLVAFVCACFQYLMPYFWHQCTPRPIDMESFTQQEKQLVEELVSFNCQPHEYNQVASLFFTGAEGAIKQLFHFRETAERDMQTFSSGALFMFFLPYYCLACWNYGIGVPSGLFVPSLLAGAAFGRLFGHLLHKLDGGGNTFADSGTYALIGAAAMLGGMARMTISLTVIILEATGDMQYVLPLMLTLMASRFVGNVFNEGLYDIQVHVKKIPFLEEDAPVLARYNDISVEQVMSPDVKCLRPIEKVGVIFDLLTDCNHNCFPVVDTKNKGVLVGTVLRKLLTMVISKQAFGATPEGADVNADPNPDDMYFPRVDWVTLEHCYPNYPKIEKLTVSQADRDMWIDLRPYANTSPYTIHASGSVTRAYRFLRSLGLRHLCVVNSHYQVIGMITRKDLLPRHIEARLETMPKNRMYDDVEMTLELMPERSHGHDH